MSAGRSRIIGTAGHIDHGKTALVAALTGVDTDRLPEERIRGISIDLGFAPIDLGQGRPPASIVDVPGHEAFVKTMVAGATGFDAVLFVVAADEGWMPQSEEHRIVLEALGVSRAVIAVTKADLVEPDWAELVVETVRDAVAGSPISDAPVVIVSAVTGEGIDELKDALAEAVGQAPERPALPFRMPIDRAFAVAGVGTVATGTVGSGVASVGDSLEVLPGGDRLRVRSIEVHGHAVERAEAGHRAAIGLARGSVGTMRRGVSLVDPAGGWRAVRRIDAGVWLTSSAPRSVRSGDRIRLHHGTVEVMARIYWYDERRVDPGGHGIGMLALENAVVPAVGDRFVLRAYSPVETIGGGSVLALAARRLRGRRRAARGSALAAILDAPAGERLVRRLEAAGTSGLSDDNFAVETGVGPADRPADGPTGAVGIERHGDRWFAVAVRQALMERLEQRLALHHVEQPLQEGLPLEVARQSLRPAPSAIVEAAIQGLVQQGKVERKGTVIALAGHSIELGAVDRSVVRKIRERYREAGLEPPETARVAEELDVDVGRLRELQRILERDGELVKLASDWYVAATALEAARTVLIERLSEHGRAEVGTFKELFGVSRKYLIPLLEHFDRAGVTRREGNCRVLAEPGRC